MDFLKWFVKKSVVALALYVIAFINVLAVENLATAKACCIVSLLGVLIFYGLMNYDVYLGESK